MPNQPKAGTKARQFRCEDELWETALEIARQTGETLSDVLRGALRAYVDPASVQLPFEVALLPAPVPSALARVLALMKRWEGTPDYTRTEYDKGRVDQRHEMWTLLAEALEDVEAPKPGLPVWVWDHMEGCPDLAAAAQHAGIL